MHVRADDEFVAGPAEPGAPDRELHETHRGQFSVTGPVHSDDVGLTVGAWNVKKMENVNCNVVVFEMESGGV